MKAPVPRILIFFLAVRAHGERRHGCLRPVIGDVAQDGIAWSAMSAIGERITVAPVGRVPEIAPTSVAGACIGWHQHKFTSLLPAAQNGKTCAPLDFHL